MAKSFSFNLLNVLLKIYSSQANIHIQKVFQIIVNVLLNLFITNTYYIIFQFNLILGLKFYHFNFFFRFSN